jgi:8-oxo-dGTP pyrophosphatase MutT (NUDIX family)
VDRWARLADALADLERAAPPAPPGGRHGAALALLGECDDGDLEIVYTRRRDDLSNHPGQISFPGGRVDPGETVDQAAVREATEEVGLDRGSVEVLGRLPVFYIPPSRFWLQAAVARWHAPHDLVAAEAEVAEILRVPLATLREPDRWRVVRLSSVGQTWAWQLDERHLLWGATAMVTAVLLEALHPGWSRGLDLSSFGPEREVRPWDRVETMVPRPGPARIAGIPEVPVDDPLVRAAAGDAVIDLDVAAAAVAVAAEGVAGREGVGGRRIAVLAGPGGTGKVGRAAADLLAARGVEVAVVHEPGGPLPPADAVVDALLGSGLTGELGGPFGTWRCCCASMSCRW